MKPEQIPILNPAELGRQLLGDTNWQSFIFPKYKIFHINRLEDYKDYLKFPVPAHRNTVIDFVFLTQGSSKRSKGLDSHEIAPLVFFFLPAYQITTHEYMSSDVKGYYCHFDPEILTNNCMQPEIFKKLPFLQFIGNPVVKIDAQVLPSVQNILNRLVTEYANHNPDLLLVSTYLLALFLELRPFAAPAEKLKENAALRITQHYKNALTQYIYKKQLVSEYADFLAVTPKHLNKCVKTVTGKSAHDLLNDMLLLEVKVLLKQTQLSVSEIAWKVGKEDPSDFTRFFKSKTGQTPTQYRQMA